MAQVERATSTNGKIYLTNETIAKGEDYINLGDNCSIGNNLSIGNDITIGNNAVIGNDATLGDTFIMPLYVAMDETEYAAILKGEKGILFGNHPITDYPDNWRNGYITVVDRQYLDSGTIDNPENEFIMMKIKSNGVIGINSYDVSLATDRYLGFLVGDKLIINGKIGLTKNQTFKDGAGVTKTMEITHGIITNIT